MWREENDENLTGSAASSDAELRDAGISSASISNDTSGIEDELGDDAPIDDAGDGAGPESATDTDLGSTPNAEQTI